MEDYTAKDHLNFRNDKFIKDLIGNEELLLSDKIIKINDYGFSQERIILITNRAIYNLLKKSKYITHIIFKKIIYSFKKKNSYKSYIRYNHK